MVVPIGGPGGGGLGGPGPAPAPPPPQLLRYKSALYLIAGGYAFVLFLGLLSGAVANSLNYLFVLIAAASMASRADQCMSQCIMPFFLFAVMTVFFDAINLLSTLFRPYPGASNFFASSCPTSIPALLLKNTTVYLKGATPPGEYVVPSNTKVELPEDICNTAWVVSNVAQLLGVILDIIATRVGYRMFKVSMELMQGQDDRSQMLMMAQQGFRGDGGGGPGAPGGAPPGAPGGAPGGRPTGQRPGGFQPFQGSGQTLSA
eukprot:TRINITY_DN5323_c0_g2_i1.p1 TRINITY_DN5323_c0_g2~~TRINITY_DN5323_c0_g2_i1.p1  ORF type:complete len:260 (+),score=47.79 TRINITY_DN5323_c0_g2_i1:90-869(+)